jgi:hypothetical protein
MNSKRSIGRRKLLTLSVFCLPFLGAAWYFLPHKGEEAAIREAVFHFEIERQMQAWEMHITAQRKRPPSSAPPFQPKIPQFWLETRDWNGDEVYEPAVSDETVKRLEGKAYFVRKAEAQNTPGKHLFAGRIRWQNRNRVEVSGGTMIYGDHGFLVGSGSRYIVERRDGKWVVTKEEMTAIT